jgi:hypothetical protein
MNIKTYLFITYNNTFIFTTDDIFESLVSVIIEGRKNGIDWTKDRVLDIAYIDENDEVSALDMLSTSRLIMEINSLCIQLYL